MPKDQTATGGTTGGAAAKALRKFRAPTIKVIVTQLIIDQSCRAHSGYCMISEAVKMAVAWALAVSSDLQSIRLTDPRKGLRYVYLTPRVVQMALIRFDQGQTVTPFEFTLRGAHVRTSFKRTKTPEGKVKRTAVHKLGRRRFNEPPSNASNGAVPGTIGGPAIPRIKSPAYSTRREFGLRAYVGGFDLDELDKAQMPVGAPSISDK